MPLLLMTLANTQPYQSDKNVLTFRFRLKAKDISQIAAERPTEQTSIWEMKGKKQRHIWKRGCSLALWENY